ncbi:hypothetical protein JCM8202_001979 [Rhodotorula sphaerocarpa]
MAAVTKPFSLDEEVRLTTSNSDRERIADLANVFALAVALDYLERAYVRDSITAQEYHHPCARLLGQYKTLVNLVGNWDLDAFLQEYRLDCTAAAHRLRVGVPATEEHRGARDGHHHHHGGDGHPAGGRGSTPNHQDGSSGNDSAETAKTVAETTQNFITFMDALKLRLRAKDQLHPLLTDLMQSYSRFCSLSASGAGAGADESNAPEWEGRPKMLQWLITLNRMRASEEISDEQSRQMLFDIEHAYAE